MTSFPAVLGHENVAMIETAGKDVGWSVGQRVCVEPSLSCVVRGIDPACSSCQAGHFALCENAGVSGRFPRGLMLGLNAFTGGSWAPMFVAHHSQLHAVPDDLPDEQAVLIDPMACALHGVMRRFPGDHATVLVVGGGILGLGVVACLRALGCTARVTAVARHAFQTRWFERLGADQVIQWSRKRSTTERYDDIAQCVGGRRVDGRFGNCGFIGGFDTVYDCVGSGASLTDSFKWTRARGTTVVLGTSSITLLDSTPVWAKELDVVGANGRQLEHWEGQRLHTYRVLLELVREGRLSLDGLLTHTVHPSEYSKAFRLISSRGQRDLTKLAFDLRDA
jgi:threonine dehydrogenase-like Zn-dependent dehydrogenase